MNEIPILVIAYNRPEYLEMLLLKLTECNASRIFVHLDGPKNDDPKSISLNLACLEILNKSPLVNRIGDTLIQPKNLGGKNGVIAALDWFFDTVEYGIIVEEDIDVSLTVFNYAAKYQHLLNEQGVFSLCLFNPIQNSKEDFLSSHWLPWGWVTTSSNWKSVRRDVENNQKAKVQFKGPAKRFPVRWYLNRVIKLVEGKKVFTWDAQVHAAVLNRNLKSIFPARALSKHLGVGGDAEHADSVDWWAHIELSDYVSQNPLTEIKFHDLELERVWGMNWRSLISAKVHEFLDFLGKFTTHRK
jgi:hypothetical protein